MVSTRQVTISSFHRDAWVEIDLAAVEHNVAVILGWLTRSSNLASSSGFPESKLSDFRSTSKNPAARLMAVVKSDAYGHGAPSLANVLTASGAAWLGVASVDEGCQLRNESIKAPVLILSPSPSWAIENALAADLDITIASASQIKDINTASRRQGKIANVHLKVDTGMHRLGVSPEAVSDVLNEIDSSSNLRLASIFSHLASAGDEEPTRFQSDRLAVALGCLGKKHGALLKHFASSEATRLFPTTHLDMVRVGLYLYGLEPNTISKELRPAMSVRGRINHISRIEQGEQVGYGWTWQAQRSTCLASIPIGYADGVDRDLSNRIEGLLLGHTVRQVGRISMDQMLFDITDVPDAQDGDVITLIGSEQKRPGVSSESNSGAGSDGKTLYLATWAQMLNTITYELACRLRTRLPRIYTRHMAVDGKAARLSSTSKSG